MITIENVKSKIEDLKEQKLEFINEEESEKILLREGFYFIDKYKSIFLKNNLVSEEYQDDTKFEYLYYLYYFDNELKSTLFKFILMVENRLKTKLVIFYPNSREEIFNINNKSKTLYLDVMFSKMWKTELCISISFLNE